MNTWNVKEEIKNKDKREDRMIEIDRVKDISNLYLTSFPLPFMTIWFIKEKNSNRIKRGE